MFVNLIIPTILANCMLFDSVLACSSKSKIISTNQGEILGFKTVDLCLEKTPQSNRRNWEPNLHKMRNLMTKAAAANELKMQRREMRRQNYNHGGANSPRASERMHVGNKTSVLGSKDLVTDTGHDAGLLSTVHEAYSYHYNLRTGPEDWWYTIIQTVALAIDKNSKSNEVRKFFVQHEGKKELAVQVGTGPLLVENIDYSWLFDQFSQKIEENINIPEYVRQMTADFSTTTSIHRIVSQITLMTSVQEFFEYTAFTMCGIPAIEMKGTKEDWIRLGTKIKALRQTLKPIENAIGLGRTQYGSSWWDKVEEIATKLLDTFNGYPDEDWWSKIITKRSFGSGAPKFNGWFMKDFLNINNAATIGSAPSGLVSIPLNLCDGARGIEEKSAVIAGMFGYKFHPQTSSKRPAVEPMHGWTLLLEPNSLFRQDLTDWEQNIINV